MYFEKLINGLQLITWFGFYMFLFGSVALIITYAIFYWVYGKDLITLLKGDI